MTYVFDTNSFRILGNYFPLRFPSFWKQFNVAVADEQVVSTREVYNELQYQLGVGHLSKWIEDNKRNGAVRLKGKERVQHLSKWIENNKGVFLVPQKEETRFVARILGVPHFHQMIGREAVFQGYPVADPFVIACAAVRKGCVVTEESLKENAAKIPNVCEHFGVKWTNLEGFMNGQGWEF